MASSLDLALLSRSYPLPRGLRVRLRLARPRDERSIRELLEQLGAEGAQLEAARLARADPRRRLVICATALIGSVETLLGVGEIELGLGAAVPSAAIIDDQLSEELGELLTSALVGRATAIQRARAA
jgi:hypothetical protein